MITCDQCNGACCRYVAVEIDEPETLQDFDDIRWYVSHKNIVVYQDNDDDWLIAFYTPCDYLQKDNRCGIYEERMKICRDHDLENCERNGEGEFYQILFTKREDVEKYVAEHPEIKSEEEEEHGVEAKKLKSVKSLRKWMGLKEE